MKVQIFPKLSKPITFFVTPHPIGALTLKPLAYESRPWEKRKRWVYNYFDGVGGLEFHTRGDRLVGLVHPTLWLRDRLRFVWDGFRRQRLTSPTYLGNYTGWSSLMCEFLTGLTRGWAPRVDPGGTHLFWFWQSCSYYVDGRLPEVALAVDCNYRGTYVGGFGLRAVESAVLGVPVWTTYEEEQVLAGPTGGSSLFLWGCLVGQVLFFPFHWWDPFYVWPVLPLPREGTPRVSQRALFQVSPLQNLLDE